MKNFGCNASAMDEIVNDIDDDIIDAILEENEIGDGVLHPFHRIDKDFLETLKDCNQKDHKNTKKIEGLLFDTKEESIISNNTGIKKRFDPYVVEPFTVGRALTKEQQMENINRYSKNLQATFLELKRSSKKEQKKEPAVPLPASSKYRDLPMMTDAQVQLTFSTMVGRTQESFPVKLHKVIDQIERDGLSSIMSWSPHGRAFKIHNKLFVEEVMTKYFYQTKMSSFTRQLGRNIHTMLNMILWCSLMHTLLSISEGMYGFQILIGKKNPDKGEF